jgi:hypothetical protein
LADAKKWEAVRSECIFWQAIWYQLVEDDIMYLFETGLGQIGEGLGRKGTLAPKDSLLEVVERWEMFVTFRTGLQAFRKEVVTAIGQHVAASEKKKIGGLIDPDLKRHHEDFSKSTQDFDGVIIYVTLTFKGSGHTGLTEISIMSAP